ncbi:MAG: hypothetical protein ABSE06_01655 [Anaerolineaceae bacterium]|jgi:uncharacterized membrane protein
MLTISVNNSVLIMAATLFVLGILCVIFGMIILVSKVMGGDIKEITKQSIRLAQKGIAEDVAGLVGNASTLVDAVNQMVRTASGVGIFLVVVGFPLILLAYYLLMQVK